jgi:diacylglycerol kinase (ATP)
MKTCVIFNPAAKGNKARHFRAQLDAIGAAATLKKTAAPQDARRLAAEAVAEGFEVIAAAGGDGTINEVLNGITDADALDRVRLGVLPLGTVNVFARELKIPLNVGEAWQLIQRGNETRIDLGWADFSRNGDGRPPRRYFAQLAGAGLDARAIELVDWQHKKAVGPVAYVIAGFRALAAPQARITVAAEGQTVSGELVLVGNGRFYGGSFAIFPGADLRDGRLDVCVFPRVNLWEILRNVGPMLFTGKLPERAVRRVRAAGFTLTSETAASFEMDGEWVGPAPATFGVTPGRLRVIVP